MKYLIGIFLCFSINIDAQIIINWQIKSSMPSFPRGDFGAFMIDSNYYVVGGIDSIENATSQVWRYTVTTDHWQQMNNFAGGSYSQQQCLAIDGKGYLVTGLDSVSGYDCDNQFWEYDPLSDNWIRKADFPGGKRRGATSFSFKGKGYFTLGVTCSVALENNVWKYDPSLDSWVIMPDTMPSWGRYGCINSVYDSSAYFIGGSNINSIRLHDMWRYNIQHDSWDSLSPLPGVGRVLCLVYAFKDILLAGYGGDDNGNSLGDCHVYNYLSHTWTPVTMNNFHAKTIGNQNTCFTYKRTAYCFGGARSPLSFYNDMRSFDATPYLPTTNVGISDAAENGPLRAYPNPLSVQGILTLDAPETGEVAFYNTVGQVIYAAPINRGVNSISCALLHVTGVVFYTAVLSNGIAEKGKIVIMK